MVLDYGWAYVTQSGTNMWLAVEDGWELNIKDNPSIDHYPGNTHLSYNLEETQRTIVLKGVILKTTADLELMIANFKTMNAAGYFTLKMKIISAGTYFKWDGTNTEISVFCLSIRGITKIARGDGTVYKIRQINFEEAA